jgi:D-alanyl-D-alanine dipeptidase
MPPLRPWSFIPIHDNGDELLELPAALLRLEPHPYRELGAPYGSNGCPFRLRSGVVQRLLQAQGLLRQRQEGVQLAIFDGWRPLAVQRFMVEWAYGQECRQRGLDPHEPGPDTDAVRRAVGRFWAPPSDDPATPPPHSTGAAVDLTLATLEGEPLDMGGAIDAIGPQSEPNHHAAAAAADPNGAPARWHRRRQLLAEVLAEVGLARHPNEWWHLSPGDQLWAWRCGEARAHYGRVPEQA